MKRLLRCLALGALAGVALSVARAPLDVVDQRHVVDDGIGIGHADDGRDAARSGGLTGRAQGLAVLGSGLAGEDVHVDQAGADDVAGAVDDGGAVRRIAAQMPSEIGDRFAVATDVSQP